MIRITATKQDEARLEIIEYDILAWLSWPVHLLAESYRKLREAIELYAKGSCTVASTEWCQEYFVPSGAVRNPGRHKIVKGAMLPPCRRKWSYETRTDYVSAAVDGVGSSVIFRGKVERRHRPER